MKDGVNIRNAILDTLTQNDFISGQQLAQQLNVSRATVSNHVKALQALGLDIFSVTGKGYRLAQSLDLLDIAYLLESTQGNIVLFNVIDSTNQYIRDNLASLNQGAICVAEAQTSGRGRRGNEWQSPFAANLYLSMLWRFDAGYQALDGLSLAVGVAVAQTLESLYDIKVQLKWPNDIYCQGRKMGGILIEVEGQFDGACNTIIGIGLNVAMPRHCVIDQAWTDLSAQVSTPINRNQLLAALINHLRTTLAAFEQHGFGQFVALWQQRNVFAEQKIRLLMGNQTIVGTCKGIDVRGGLLLEQDERIQAYYGGEISVRLNK